MAVVEFVEAWEQRSGDMTWQPGGRGTARFVRTYTRVFRARTDSTLDGPLTVELYDLAPKLGEPYFDPSNPPTYDFGAAVVKRAATQDQDDPWQWLLRVDYSSDLSKLAEIARDGGFPKNAQDSNSALNPILRPPKIRWGTNRFQRAWQIDLRGNIIVNSAGDPFDPPITTDDDRPVLTITRNVPAFDESLAYKYRNAVNSDTFLGAKPGQLKIAGTITADSAFENNLFYWEMTAALEYKEDLWIPYQVLDQGYQVLDASGSKDRARTDFGEPAPSQVCLDGTGKALKVKQTGTLTAGSTTVAALPAAAQLLGCTVSGPGIPAGTTVASVNAPNVTLSQPATLSGSQTLFFAYYKQFFFQPQLPFAALGLL